MGLDISVLKPAPFAGAIEEAQVGDITILTHLGQFQPIFHNLRIFERFFFLYCSPSQSDPS